MQRATGQGATSGGVAQKGGKKGVATEAASGDAGKPSASKRRKSDVEMLRGLDSRVFRHVEAGQCREEGCEVRGEAHCHRGPGCDCTR